MSTFDSSDQIWKILAAIDSEPTGEFRNLVEAAQLDPKTAFRNAFLVNLPLKCADISGFDFSGSDLRGTDLRYVARFDDAVISKETKLDPADLVWWQHQQETKAVLANYFSLMDKATELVNKDSAINQRNAIGDTALLERAVGFYHNALDLVPKEDFLAQWTATQAALGDALQRLAVRENGRKRLAEADRAYAHASLTTSERGAAQNKSRLDRELSGMQASGAMAASWPGYGSPFHSRAEAVQAVKAADLLLVIALFLIMIGGYHVHAMLTIGDWDFWVDWKDRRFWPTVLPIMLVTFPAAAQYFFWVHFRLPFGATFLCLALLTGEWIDRYVSFWGWTFFPITLCWPTSLIPQAMFMDIVLLLSKSWVITGIVGSMGFSLLLYPNNWVILAPYHQASEQYGTLMSLADIIGFHYVRTSMPEYIRIIERGTMRTFGKDVVGVAAFFSGFASIIVYFVWWYVGKMFSTVKYMATI